MNNNEFKKGIAVGVAVTLVVTGTGFAGYQKIMFPKGSALSDTKTVQKLNYLESLINEEYLEEKEEDSLREGLYAGIMSGLNDPYSTYYTAEQYTELNTSNEGSYVGIGAVLQNDKDGGAKIVQLYEGGSGEQAGLKKGDVLKAIDGEDVTEKETSDIASMIRESDKDSVTLTIQRNEETKEIKVEIRDVEIQTVSHEMLDDETGYIRISEFSEVTSNQYKKAFEDTVVLSRSTRTIFKYHQARRNTKNYQVDLETLQYDLLYGKQYTYDEKNPFERTKMRMGIC